MVTAQMFRVFTDAHGKFGDKASVVMDESRQISDDQRKIIASKLNTGETIFINSINNMEISVMHPQGEIGFAGVGVLATAWLLKNLRDKPTKKLVGRDGDILVWQEENITWVRANTETLPKWNMKQLASVAEVEHIKFEL